MEFLVFLLGFRLEINLKLECRGWRWGKIEFFWYVGLKSLVSGFERKGVKEI